MNNPVGITVRRIVFFVFIMIDEKDCPCIVMNLEPVMVAVVDELEKMFFQFLVTTVREVKDINRVVLVIFGHGNEFLEEERVLLRHVDTEMFLLEFFETFMNRGLDS